MTAPFEIEALDVTKRFGALVANDGITLRVARGEVHALMGENGAGKSTLMSILYGAVQPDAGTILVRGRETALSSPGVAIANGIGMVHQNFKLFEPLTVWENVVFGAEPRRRGFVDARAAIDQVRALAERFGMAVEPKATIDSLSVGLRQRVEILKALYRDARTLILDEPTAVLGPKEREGLFAVVRELTADGRTVILVTHKIREVMDVSDNVTVLRHGKVTGRMRTADADGEAIVRAMTGRAVHAVTRTRSDFGPVVLAARGLTIAPGGAKPLLDGVGLEIRAGEILGVAGVAGNGQTELVEAIAGMRPVDAGSIEIVGAEVSRAGVRERRESGLSFIPEDRAATGTAIGASAEDNLLMGFHRQARFQRCGVLKSRAAADHAKALIARFGIRIESGRTPVGTLSGGNLQKVVVAREIAKEGLVLVAEQPTRGVDVGAIEYIHARLLEESGKGCAILLVSSELSELLALCDRILVMYEGRCVAEVGRAEADEALLGSLMAGGRAA